nr:hypothetical protein [Tanacetum cinerariifolium]
TIPLFPSMLVTMGEGSGTLTEPYHTPSPETQQTSPTTHSSPSLLPVTTKPLPIVISSDTTQLRQYTRRARIAQSSVLPPIADEPASPIGDDSQGEACPTDSSLEAEQDRHFDREDLNHLWALVKETLNIRQAVIEWRLYDSYSVHHILSRDQEFFMLVEREYPLRKGIAITMIINKLQVENYSQMANDPIKKIYKISNSPRQQDD